MDALCLLVCAEQRRGHVHLEHLQLTPLGVRAVVQDLQIPYPYLVLHARLQESAEAPPYHGALCREQQVHSARLWEPILYAGPWQQLSHALQPSTSILNAMWDLASRAIFSAQRHWIQPRLSVLLVARSISYRTSLAKEEGGYSQFTSLVMQTR